MNKTEITTETEQEAQFIADQKQRQGYSVSLIGFDSERNVYAFDYWKDE